MFLLILRDLQFRRWRVGLTVVLMAIVMTLLFIMTGLVEQFNVEPTLATKRVGGEMNWVVSEGTGGPFTSPRPVEATTFDGIPGEPILVAPSSINGVRISLVGRDFASMSEPVLTEGRHPTNAGDVVIDETAGFAVGDRVMIGGQPGSVVGLTSDATILAGVPVTFVTLEFAQQTALGGQDLLLAKLTHGDQNYSSDLKVMTPEMVAADALLPLDGAISSVTLVRALLWLITVIIIAAIIYITALERTRDFAVLKAVGAKTRDLGASLLVQGVLMTLMAVLIAGGLQSFLAPSFPLKVRVPSNAWLVIGGGAALAALVAGAAGVLRVKSTNPTEAFG